MSLQAPFRSLLRWLVPHGLYLLLQGARARAADAGSSAPALPPEVLANRALRGRHAGRRGFIVGNGPSINRQDLSRLAGEVVMTVSNGYHHPEFLRIAPAYHCVPRIISPNMTRERCIAWFREMHERTGSAEIVLSHSDADLVRAEGLFPGRTLRYVKFAGSFEDLPGGAIVDLSRAVPDVQSVPIMCLMLAMYLGLNPVYLLGVEHDHFRTGRYDYFYEQTLLKGLDPSVTADGRVINPLYEEFEALHRLWKQYRRMREIAAANGIEIFNATDGGALDEFPRRRLEEVLGAK